MFSRNKLRGKKKNQTSDMSELPGKIHEKENERKRNETGEIYKTRGDMGS